MRKGLLFSLALSVAAGMSAQTNIAEGNVQGVWAKDGSPYYIKGTVTIPTGEGLTIEEGVEVQFEGMHKMIVKGMLTVNGQKGNLVKFGVKQGVANWDGLRVEQDAKGLHIQYAEFQKGLSRGTDLNDQYGGAIQVNNCDNVKITNSVFFDNESNWGGAISLAGCKGVISNCTFYDNIAHYEGGAIDISFCEPTVYGCLMYNNTSNYNGGALIVKGDLQPKLIHNTIVNNTGVNGGGLYVDASAIIMNCIVYGNKEGSTSNQVFMSDQWGDDTEPQFYNNLVQGGVAAFNLDPTYTPDYQFDYASASNLDEDPMFMNAGANDFHLNESSSCVNNGISIPDSIHTESVDLEGNPRVGGDKPDMGAFEINTVGIQKFAGNGIAIYPNPTNGSITILTIQKDVQLSLVDLQGKLVQELAMGHIDLSTVQAGIYFVRMQDREGRISTEKLIVR